VKRIYLVAGEESGDIHGANLIRALKNVRGDIACEGLGGQRMAEAGMSLHHDLAGEAIMGFTEVVRKFASIRQLFLKSLAHIEATRPDALVLIDYPGFNIRLAKRVSALGIPIIFYISPQVWAWKKKRIHTLAKHVDKMLVIFPFEKKLYDEVGLDCTYVGHPLLDHITERKTAAHPSGEIVIGLLSGSREQEIARLLRPMVEVAKGIREVHPDAQFIAPVVNETRARQAKEIAGDFPLDIRVGGMYDVLSKARFCLVASGTATLETALFGVPMIIMYKVTPVTYWLARLLVDIRHIGIVNILAGREIVPEYIQGAIQRDDILPRALALINPTPERTQMLTDLQEVHATLGAGGASASAAREILTLIEGADHG
jgi:lipid-A-disaccharide synthase